MHAVHGVGLTRRSCLAAPCCLPSLSQANLHPPSSLSLPIACPLTSSPRSNEFERPYGRPGRWVGGTGQEPGFEEESESRAVEPAALSAARGGSASPPPRPTLGLGKCFSHTRMPSPYDAAPSRWSRRPRTTSLTSPSPVRGKWHPPSPRILHLPLPPPQNAGICCR